MLTNDESYLKFYSPKSYGEMQKQELNSTHLPCMVDQSSGGLVCMCVICLIVIYID